MNTWGFLVEQAGTRCMGRRIFDPMNYLDFEEPIKTLREQLDQAKEIQDKNDLDMATTVEELEVKIQEVIQEIYSKLTPWQRVQVSRHPDRPYTLDYIQALTDGNFLELHGDRTVKDDKAMVGGLGELDGRPVMFIGQQKGANTKMRQYRKLRHGQPRRVPQSPALDEARREVQRACGDLD